MNIIYHILRTIYAQDEKKNEIKPTSYGIGLGVKFHPHLSPLDEIPSLIEYILSSHVFL